MVAKISLTATAPAKIPARGLPWRNRDSLSVPQALGPVLFFAPSRQPVLFPQRFIFASRQPEIVPFPRQSTDLKFRGLLSGPGQTFNYFRWLTFLKPAFRNHQGANP
jgi:hypothetical protein